MKLNWNDVQNCWPRLLFLYTLESIYLTLKVFSHLPSLGNNLFFFSVPLCVIATYPILNAIQDKMLWRSFKYKHFYFKISFIRIIASFDNFQVLLMTPFIFIFLIVPQHEMNLAWTKTVWQTEQQGNNI